MSWADQAFAIYFLIVVAVLVGIFWEQQEKK